MSPARRQSLPVPDQFRDNFRRSFRIFFCLVAAGCSYKEEVSFVRGET